jgi:glycosyltransferase involved in cell wall biosynthesis
VGSFERRKQLERFIDYTSHLASAMPYECFRFLIFGTSKDETQKRYVIEMQDKINALSTHNLYEFRGYKNVNEVTCSANAILCLYQDEPFGRVVAEYLYAGLPVFITIEGGLLEAGCGGANVLEGTDSDKKDQLVTFVREMLTPGFVHPQDGLRRRLVDKLDRSVITSRELALYFAN